MKNQRERLLDYMKEHGSIDPMQALNELGIYRLSARINELRSDGISISSTPKKVTNRYGEDCRVAEYQLHQPVVRKYQ